MIVLQTLNYRITQQFGFSEFTYTLERLDRQAGGALSVAKLGSFYSYREAAEAMYEDTLKMEAQNA